LTADDDVPARAEDAKLNQDGRGKVEQCPQCGWTMKVIAVIERP
jgi:hypothetical protein